MKKKTVRDIDVSGKRVLVRVDFNVPVDARGNISDDSRIRAALPTIKWLLEHNAAVILMSHYGRPKGKVVESMRMGFIARRLSELLGRPVMTVQDCIGPEVENAVAKMKPGDILMLENLRFHPEEEKGDENFAAALAKLGDIYVNDAFGTSHRAHASISGVPKYLPAVAGFLLEKEINILGGLLENPERPFTAILGGAKVSDKVSIIQNFLEKVDYLLIGGGMTATFLKSRGYAVGASSVEEECLGIASQIISDAAKKNVNLILPEDVVVADDIREDCPPLICSIDNIPENKKIADIGPKTIARFTDILKKSRTVFWNGPVGVVEIEQFANGTKTIAYLLSQLDATTIVGGGSTAETVAALGIADKITFVSTGGGASMEFLGGAELPGVAALMDK